MVSTIFSTTVFKIFNPREEKIDLDISGSKNTGKNVFKIPLFDCILSLRLGTLHNPLGGVAWEAAGWLASVMHIIWGPQA